MLELNRKFEEIYDISDYEILTDNGWKNISKVMKTEKYQIWYIKLENGMFLKCADDHIVFDKNMNEIFIKDLKIGDLIQTKNGLSNVIEINKLKNKENMYDVEVENHRYYSNGILSHNTECVGAYTIWYACFNSYKRIGIGSNKEKSAKSFLSRIKFMYERIPQYLKPGVLNWAEKSVRFDNGTIIEISATSKDAFRGEPLSLLILDELAFVEPPWKAEEFWKSNYPTISASKTSKIIIISTPCGLHNLFHRIYTGAKNKTNSFVCSTYDWRCVPSRDDKWAKEQLDNMGKLSFVQEFSVNFIGSSKTVINSEVLNFLVEKPEVYPSLIDLNGKFRIYEKPEKNLPYILGVDVSKGTGGDYSVVQVIKIISSNPLQLKQVAVFEDNEIDPYHFSEIVNKISFYYNNSFIMVENNAEGSTVVNQLHWEFENEKLINTGSKIKDLGIRATRSTKPKAVILMKKLIEDGSLELVDKRTIEQLTDFTDNENNKYSCLNMNDDLLSGLYWGCYFLSMDILDEDFKLKKLEDLKKDTDEDDVWGILSDVQFHQEEDWNWL